MTGAWVYDSAPEPRWWQWRKRRASKRAVFRFDGAPTTGTFISRWGADGTVRIDPPPVYGPPNPYEVAHPPHS